MNGLQPILGIAMLLLSAGLLFIFTLPRKTRAGARARLVLRPIRAMQRMRRALGLAVEEGTRLHISLGKSSIISPTNASAFVALSALERIGMQSSISDRPPITTGGEGTLAILGQDTLRAAYRLSSVPEMFDPSQARLAGPTPFSYAAGTLPIIHDESVSANLLIGNFGPEVGLMIAAADQQNAVVIASSDSLAAQAVMYTAAAEPLIGEELFAIPGYLQGRGIQYASVRVQDVLRWVIIAILILGAFIRLFLPGL